MQKAIWYQDFLSSCGATAVNEMCDVTSLFSHSLNLKYE